MNAGVIDMAGNPFAFVLKGLVAAKRECTLNNAELVRRLPWMQKNYSETVADALLITLYRGVRSGEVCTAEAHEIEESPAGMVWLVPARDPKKHIMQKVLGLEVWAHAPSCPHNRHASKDKCPVEGWACWIWRRAKESRSSRTLPCFRAGFFLLRVDTFYTGRQKFEHLFRNNWLLNTFS